MFDPKGSNLLDEQLAVSGLEMFWLPAVIAGGAALFGGIMGMNQAKSNNANAKANTKAQQKHNEEVAERTNAYNKLKDENQEANYHAMRDHNLKVTMSNWRRGKEIQDYKFDSTMKEYEKSQAIGSAQLGLNSQDAAAAIESEGQSLTDSFLQKQFSIVDSYVNLQDELQRQNLSRQSVAIESEQVKQQSSLSRRAQTEKLMTASANLKQTYTQQNINRQEQYTQLQGIRSREQTGAASIENTIEQLTSQGNFQKETAMIEGLLSEGTASLGQAGKSTAKSRQASKAQLQRSLMALSSEMSGKRNQASIKLAELNAEMSLAKTGVGLNLQRISSAVSGAEDAMAATQRDVATQISGITLAQRVALANTDIKMASINDAISIADRDYIYNRQMIDANYESAKGQSGINIKNIGLQKQYADLNTQASMMLKPDKLSYDPKPRRPPEHIFLKSQEAIPGFVPSPAMQNPYIPLVQGISQGAGAIASADFSEGPFGN